MLAIVPVNAHESAKRRLASVLPLPERIALVRAMLADVVSACESAEAITEVLVVTPDPLAVPNTVRVLVDDGLGHAEAIRSALAQAPAEGAVVVMADCPLVRPETLDRLARSARPIALCAARDGGTNALALRPAHVIEPAFGIRNGAAVNLARAHAAGFEATLINDVRLASDVDTPSDLERVLELGAGTRTLAFLASSAPLPDASP